MHFGRVLSTVVLFLLLVPAPAQAADWQHAAANDDIACFAFASPRTIERYDMLSESWLIPIPLSASPTALAVDDDGIYVSYGRQTVRMSHAGGSESHLSNTSWDARGLFYSMNGISIAPSRNRFFGEAVELARRTSLALNTVTMAS